MKIEEFDIGDYFVAEEAAGPAFYHRLVCKTPVITDRFWIKGDHVEDTNYKWRNSDNWGFYPYKAPQIKQEVKDLLS